MPASIRDLLSGAGTGTTEVASAATAAASSSTAAVSATPGAPAAMPVSSFAPWFARHTFSPLPPFSLEIMERQLQQDRFYDSPFARDNTAVAQTFGADDFVLYSACPSPAAQLLLRLPFLFPFSLRVDIFYALIEADKRAWEHGRVGRAPVHFQHGMGASIQIRRPNLIEDAFQHFNSLGHLLKGRVRVQFVAADGVPEAGIDGGGLFKEFLNTTIKAVFNTDMGLFCESHQHELFPNPTSLQRLGAAHEEYFELLGRLIGKALYDQILVEPRFAHFFLRKLQGKLNVANDLVSLDTALYRSLMLLKNYPGDLKDLDLTFVTSNGDHEIELLPGGATEAVTKATCFRFIALMAHFKLNSQIRIQTQAFLRGLQVCE
jgi:ubiquitin-protein ligase E3 C